MSPIVPLGRAAPAASGRGGPRPLQGRRAAPRARLRSLAGFVLLALALVSVQRAAALHWLSHAVAATEARAEHPAPVDGGVDGSAGIDHCADCALFAAVASGAATSVVGLAASAVHHVLHEPPGSTPEARAPPLAFRSRAPPIPV